MAAGRVISEFKRRVVSAVRRIPPGRVATYGDIAALAGSPRAWRAVGSIMRDCRDPSVPCHRVIASAGGLGGYGSNLQVKRELLRAEGLDVGMTRVRRFAEVRWNTKPAAIAKTGTRATGQGGEPAHHPQRTRRRTNRRRPPS